MPENPLTLDAQIAFMRREVVLREMHAQRTPARPIDSEIAVMRAVLATLEKHQRLVAAIAALDKEAVNRHVDVAEVRLDTGKTMAWPTEWIFREDGSDV